MPPAVIIGTYIGESSSDGGYLSFVKWPHTPRVLVYRIQDNLPHWPFFGNPRAAIRRAAEKWNAVLAPVLVLKEATDKDVAADIDIEVTKANLFRLGGGDLGFTELDYDPKSPVQDIVHVKCRVRQLITQLFNGTSTEAVALHELGHALGNRGHVRSDSIMTSRVPRKAELTTRDIATVRYRYGLPRIEGGSGP